MWVSKNTTGVDITSKRFGVLEKKLMAHVMSISRGSKIYDLGSGKSFFSFVLAFWGMKVTSIDKSFKPSTFVKFWLIKKVCALSKFSIKKQDIGEMSYKDFDKGISVVYSSRFLHYLPYHKARSLLKIICSRLEKDGKVFFSISGIDSDLAEGYKGKKKKLQERFFNIGIQIQERFEVKEKVCLYSQREVEELFEEFFDVEEVWESQFKNIFIIARKRSLEKE